MIVQQNSNLINTLQDYLYFTTDKTKIIITLDDFKFIPDLNKVIPIEKIIKEKKITLSEFPFDDQNKLITIFLKKYNFIQKFVKTNYFDYEKMLKFWPKNERYLDYFKGLEPDIKTNNSTFYKLTKIDDFMLNYIGLMFFSAYSKIENSFNIVDKEYDFFTDVDLSINNFNIIKDIEQFFLQEFLVFIQTTYGTVFGSNIFGSNLKKFIQSKENYILFKQLEIEITSFIKDFKLLYNNIDLKNFQIIKINDYSYKINLAVIINEKSLGFSIVINS